MRIAQIAPLTEAVPPKLYGGTERVISWLTEELVALGHEVTLFASGEFLHLSQARSRCGRAPCASTARCAIRMRSHMTMLEQVRQRADEFDLLHFHLDYYPFSLFSRQADAVPDDAARPARPARAPAGLRHVLLGAGRLDLERAAAARCRRPTGCAPSITACPRTLLTPQPVEAVLSRLPRPHLAGESASIARSGSPSAAACRSRSPPRSIGPTSDYFERADQAADRASRASSTSARSATTQKSEFLSGAIALLVPIDWPEPFGLVMIEAMACGTPVIAFNRGSVPEIVEDGVTGFIVEDETSAVGAVQPAAAICRARASASASRSASPRAAWRRIISTALPRSARRGRAPSSRRRCRAGSDRDNACRSPLLGREFVVRGRFAGRVSGMNPKREPSRDAGEAEERGRAAEIVASVAGERRADDAPMPDRGADDALGEVETARAAGDVGDHQRHQHAEHGGRDAVEHLHGDEQIRIDRHREQQRRGSAARQSQGAGMAAGPSAAA